jgi:hypothetical protein
VLLISEDLMPEDSPDESDGPKLHFNSEQFSNESVDLHAQIIGQLDFQLLTWS